MHLKIHLKRCIFSAVFYSTIRPASHSCLGCHCSSTETTPAAADDDDTRTQNVYYSYTYTYACTFPPYWRQRNMAIISSLTLKCWFCGFTFGNIRKYTPFPDNDEILIWVIMMMMPSKVAAVTTEWLIITSGPPTDLSACFSRSFLNSFLVFSFY